MFTRCSYILRCKEIKKFSDWLENEKNIHKNTEYRACIIPQDTKLGNFHSDNNNIPE